MSYTESLYAILGIHEEASQQEIKQAYKKAALRTHPDRALPERKQEADANFKKVAEAYEILSDPNSRHHYNLYGTPSSPSPMSTSRARAQRSNPSSSSSSPNTYFGVSPDSKPFTFQWESSYDSARRAQAQRGSGNRRHFGVDPFQLFNEMFEGGMGGSVFDDPFRGHSLQKTCMALQREEHSLCGGTNLREKDGPDHPLAPPKIVIEL